jgi:hypothetical protein
MLFFFNGTDRAMAGLYSISSEATQTLVRIVAEPPFADSRLLL